MKKISEHLRFECINTRDEKVIIEVIFCKKSEFSDEDDRFFIVANTPVGYGWFGNSLFNTLVNPPEKVKELMKYVKWHGFSIHSSYLDPFIDLRYFYINDMDFFKQITLFGALKDDVLPDVDNVIDWSYRRIPSLMKMFERDMETFFGKV